MLAISVIIYDICLFSFQTLLDPYFISFYNVFYTSLPVLAMGIFEQVVFSFHSTLPGSATNKGLAEVLTQFNPLDEEMCIVLHRKN